MTKVWPSDVSPLPRRSSAGESQMDGRTGGATVHRSARVAARRRSAVAHMKCKESSALDGARQTPMVQTRSQQRHGNPIHGDAGERELRAHSLLRPRTSARDAGQRPVARGLIRPNLQHVCRTGAGKAGKREGGGTRVGR